MSRDITMLAKEKSDQLIAFYGGMWQAKQTIESHNKGTIVVCPRCEKVDIDVIRHPEQCSPSEEYERRQANDVYWK